MAIESRWQQCILAAAVAAMACGKTGDEVGPPTYLPLGDSEAASRVLDAARLHVALRAAGHNPVPAPIARRREPGWQRGPLLGRGLVKLVERGDSIRPARRGAKALDIAFPHDARDPLTFDTGKMHVGVSLVGAQESHAEAAGGYVVYRDAFGRGAHVLHRPSGDGDEDFMLLDTAPRDSSVRYSVSLGEGVAGLRLVANTLEILDAGGAPRLRMAAPYLVGADGRTVPAEIALSGCAADRSVLPPWDRAPTASGSDTCAVSVHWRAEDVRYPAILDPAWSSAGSMSVPRWGHTATALASGRVLVTGGIGETTGVVVHPSAEIYDPGTGTWSMAAPMATPRYVHTATLLSSGAVLVVAGWGAVGAESSCELYDPATGLWTTAASMSATRYDSTATRLNDGSVLLAAGVVADNWSASAERYFPATNTWAATGSLHATSELHTANRLQNGNVLLAGGSNASFRSGAEVYDHVAGVWSVVGSMGTARFGHTSQTLLNGKVLVAGGVAEAVTWTPLATTELFDPATGTWTPGPSMNVPRYFPTMSILSNGSVLEAGGYIGGGVPGTTPPPASFTGTAEIYSPLTNTWTATATMASTRQNHAQSAATNGRILVVGGGNDTGVLATAELFYPDSSHFCMTCGPVVPFAVSLEFFQGGSSVVRKSYPADEFTWAWGQNTLVPLPAFGFNSGLEARFYSELDVPGQFNTAEALVFARDPAEMRDTLAGILNDPTTWEIETDAGHMPWALDLKYPPTFTAPDTRSPLTTATFWDFPAIPQGAAAFPGGLGSVKSAFTYRTGACSTKVPFATEPGGAPGILNVLADQLSAKFAEAATDNGCFDSERRWLHTNSYLTHQSVTNPDILAKGGMFVEFYYHNHIYIPGIQDQNIYFNYRYEFGLSSEGILVARAFENQSDVNGYDAANTRAKIRQALDVEVPQGIFKAAYEEQTDTEHFGTCTVPTPAPGQAEDTSIGADPANPTCASRWGVEGAARRGAVALGHSQAEADQVAATTLATYDDGSGQAKLKYWRCVLVPTPAEPTQHRCEYRVPAKRVNTFPDRLEVVLFDGPEPDSNGYAAFAAKVGGPPGATPNVAGALDEMCTVQRPVSTTDVWRRPFKKYYPGAQTTAASSSTCAQTAASAFYEYIGDNILVSVRDGLHAGWTDIWEWF